MADTLVASFLVLAAASVLGLIGAIATVLWAYFRQKAFISDIRSKHAALEATVRLNLTEADRLDAIEYRLGLVTEYLERFGPKIGHAIEIETRPRPHVAPPVFVGVNSEQPNGSAADPDLAAGKVFRKPGRARGPQPDHVTQEEHAQATEEAIYATSIAEETPLDRDPDGGPPIGPASPNSSVRSRLQEIENEDVDRTHWGDY